MVDVRNSDSRLRRAIHVLCLCLPLCGASSAIGQMGSDWRTAVEKAVRDQPQLQQKTVSVEWIDAKIDQLPKCSSPRATLPNSSRPAGRITVALRCESSRWVGSIQIVVLARRPFLVSSRPLAAGTVVSEDDLTMSEADWLTVPEDVTEDATIVVGKTLLKGLTSGMPITLNSLRQTSVIRSGERVRVEVIGQGFSITGEAVAVESGAIDEQIKVRMTNGQILNARVARRGVVELKRD